MIDFDVLHALWRRNHVVDGGEAAYVASFRRRSLGNLAAWMDSEEWTMIPSPERPSDVAGEIDTVARTWVRHQVVTRRVVKERVVVHTTEGAF